MTILWTDIVGWIGMVFLLGAFFAASTRRLREDRYLYHSINLLGSTGVLINACVNHVWAMVGVEAAWGTIALIGLWKIYQHARSTHVLG